MRLSIIIPVYNIENYLSQCLDSILNQSFQDFEIICVNDGSTDNSLNILNKYKEKDDRIKIITKDNEGSGIARNTALKKAIGDYIFFVDGDDWIEENSLEEIINEASKLSTDILIFGGYSCYKKGNVYKKQNGSYSANRLPKNYFNRIFSSKDIKSEIFKFPSTVWTKVYKREFLVKNNIQCQQIKVGQDQLMFFHSMITADKIAILPKNFYCYRKNRKGSAMTVVRKKNLSPIYVFYGIENLLENLNKLDEYKYMFVNKYFSKATSWLGRCDESIKNMYFEEYTKLLEHIKNKYNFGWWNYFNANKTDGYWSLKFKKYMAKYLINYFHA